MPPAIVPPVPDTTGTGLLPPQLPKDAGKICLVLDLDETLVHSSFRVSRTCMYRFVYVCEQMHAFTIFSFYHTTGGSMKLLSLLGREVVGIKRIIGWTCKESDKKEWGTTVVVCKLG